MRARIVCLVPGHNKLQVRLPGQLHTVQQKAVLKICLCDRLFTYLSVRARPSSKSVQRIEQNTVHDMIEHDRYPSSLVTRATSILPSWGAYHAADTHTQCSQQRG